MPKVAILSIGLSRFVLPPKANVGAILSVLSDAQCVDFGYDGDTKVFFPEGSSYRGEISVEYIDTKQLRAESPRKSKSESSNDIEVTPALTGRKVLALGGGQS